MFGNIKYYLSELLEDALTREVRVFLKDVHHEIAKSQTTIRWYGVKVKDCKSFEAIRNLPADKKLKMLLICISNVSRHWQSNSWDDSDHVVQYSHVSLDILNNLMRSDLEFDTTNLQQLSDSFFGLSQETRYGLVPWSSLANQLEWFCKRHGINESIEKILRSLIVFYRTKNFWNEREKIKMVNRIEEIIFKQTAAPGDDSVKPFYIKGEDNFIPELTDFLKPLDGDEKYHWHKILNHAQKNSGSKPTKKFLTEAATICEDYGLEKFKKQVITWFNYLVSMKEISITKTSTYANRTYTETNITYLTTISNDLVKGLVWMCVNFNDKQTLISIASLCERSFRKIPNVGAAAAAVGNACIFVLSENGLDGISHLSRLRLRIKQASTQKLIEKYLQSAATSMGMSVEEIEDMAVNDAGLVNGEIEFRFDDYKLKLQIEAIGKVNQQWIKADGSLQKAAPVFVKEKFSKEFSLAKTVAKQIELNLSGNRDRLDRTLKNERIISWTHFEKYYLNHGLMSFITNKLICKL